MTEPTPDAGPTDQPTPVPAPESPVEAQTGDSGTDTADDDATFDPRAREAMRKLRGENHSLRNRLRTVEGDYETATTRLTAHHRREVERIAATTLVDPTDIWTTQPDVAVFYDQESQDVVGDKVTAAAQELTTQKPHLAKPPTAPPPTNRPLESLRTGARAPEETKATTWASAIRGH